jgi:hypothetical protein
MGFEIRRSFLREGSTFDNSPSLISNVNVRIAKLYLMFDRALQKSDLVPNNRNMKYK